MRKRFYSYIISASALILLAVLSACAAEPPAPPADTGAVAPGYELSVDGACTVERRLDLGEGRGAYTVKLVSASAGPGENVLKRVELYGEDDGEIPIQISELEGDGNAWLFDLGQDFNFVVEDLNFDGWPDFRCFWRQGTGGVWDYCWLCDPETQTFQRSGALENIPCLEADPEHRCVRGYAATPYGSAVTLYRWTDGRLDSVRQIYQGQDFSRETGPDGGVPMVAAVSKYWYSEPVELRRWEDDARFAPGVGEELERWEEDPDYFGPEDAMVYPDPITAFFDEAHFACHDTLSEGARAGAEAVAWEAELRHAFARLAEDASPRAADWGVDPEAILEDYLAFARAQAEAEAYVQFTDAYGDELGQYHAPIGRGTGFGGGEQQAYARLLERLVKDLYTMFGYPNGSFPATSSYVFDPEAALGELEGIPYESWPVLIDPSSEPEPEWPGSPIDDWLLEHAVFSGSTAAMSEDAALKRDIWYAELLHAYDSLIAHAHPTARAPRQALERARDAYLDFVPDYAVLEALYCYAGAFTPASWREEPDGDLRPGSLYHVSIPSSAGNLYRTLTCELWGLLDSAGVWPDGPDCAFNPADWAGRVQDVSP